MRNFADRAVFQYGFHHSIVNLAVAKILGNGFAHIFHRSVAIVFVQVLHNKVIGQFVGVGYDNLIDGDGKDGIFAGKFGIALVRIGESDFDIEGFAGFVADELLQEVIDVAGDADGDFGAGAIGAAALKLDAIHFADIIDVNGIAIRYFAVGDFLFVGVAGHDGVDLLLDVLLLDGDGAFLISNAGVLAQSDVILGGDALKVSIGGQTQAIVYSGIAIALLVAAGGKTYAEHKCHKDSQHFYKFLHFGFLQIFQTAHRTAA